jgi:hypothetical protein
MRYSKEGWKAPALGGCREHVALHSWIRRIVAGRQCSHHCRCKAARYVSKYQAVTSLTKSAYVRSGRPRMASIRFTAPAAPCMPNFCIPAIIRRMS